MKLTEMAKKLHDTERLISEMKAEIDDLRNTVARYYRQHGEEIFTSTLTVEDNISFDVSVQGCRKINHDALGIESRYQIILKSLDEL